MPLTHDQALQELRAWTMNPSLLGHARAVEIVMRAAASKYGGDPEVWGITGLLHDADYDQWPEDHPKRIVDWLREQGEEEIAYAVSFHQTAWGLPPKTTMDKCLLACDELTGFVIACCLVRPEGIATLEPKSVKKKLKDKAFAILADSLPAAEQEPRPATVKASKPSAGVTAQKAYVPEPQPVRTPILVGAHNCPLWEANQPQMWNQVLKHPERTPALGFYSQENPEVADWETKWAVEHGILVLCLLLVSQRSGRASQDAFR